MNAERIATEFQELAEDLLESGMGWKQIHILTQTAVVAAVVRQCGGNQCAAARKMGVHRNTVCRLMKQYRVAAGRRKALERRTLDQLERENYPDLAEIQRERDPWTVRA